MKVYMKPVTQVIEIELQSMCAATATGVTSTTGLEGVTMGEGDYKGGSTDSRRGGFWDDEE